MKNTCRERSDKYKSCASHHTVYSNLCLRFTMHSVVPVWVCEHDILFGALYVFTNNTRRSFSSEFYSELQGLKMSSWI